MNNAAGNADGTLVALVGDSTQTLVLDANSGNVAVTLGGHTDFSFACTWSSALPLQLVTGNQVRRCNRGLVVCAASTFMNPWRLWRQDRRACVWDLRRPSMPTHVLAGQLAAIRSSKFFADGQLLALSESADFLHIFDVGRDFNRCQSLRFYSEISGFDVSRAEDGNEGDDSRANDLDRDRDELRRAKLGFPLGGAETLAVGLADSVFGRLAILRAQACDSSLILNATL